MRYRIDGIMAPAARVPRRQAARVISRIKILSDLDIAERRMPQDGRTTAHLEGRRVDVRVTIVPLVNGESAVMRILDPRRRAAVARRARHGRRGPRARRIRAAALARRDPRDRADRLGQVDLALRVGRRRELAGEDDHDDRGPRRVPPHGRQADAGLRARRPDLLTGLRAIVRADPDIIMVGEMRDRESARIAIEAALTGHLVLSTLHTNSAPATPARLIDMGVEPYLVASAIDCVHRAASRAAPVP